MRSTRWVLGSVVALLVLMVFAAFVVGLLAGPGSVRRINRDNPQLIQAIKTAQAGLPDFLKQLQHPNPGQRFAFMARFKTPNGNEYLWLKDPALRAKQLVGTLDQPPMAASMRRGDVVTVDTADVVDWYIKDADGTSHGKFTEHLQ
jgi:uncharacterized protein YegJ (DUF2314 family)